MKNIEISNFTIPYYDDVIIDFINNNIRFHTIPLFIKSGSTEFAPVGTGVLVFIYDVYCVFTSSHVTERMDDQKNLYFQCGQDNYIPCSETEDDPDCKTNSKYLGANHIILDQESIDQLLAIGMQFLTIDKILDNHDGLQSIQYAIFGYPTDLVEQQAQTTKTNGLLFISAMADEVPYDKYNYTKETHYIMPYTTPTDIGAGSKTKPKQLYGMSGSGLWYISVTHELDKNVYDYHLIGIMHEYYLHKKIQFIVGNKISVVTDQLRAGFTQS